MGQVPRQSPPGPVRSWVGEAKMGPEGSVTRLIQFLRSDDAAERDVAVRLIWSRYYQSE